MVKPISWNFGFRPLIAASRRPESNGRICPRPCENSNTRAAVYEFQSVFGIFGHYRPGRAKKFAPDAPFSDNFRVFTRSGTQSGRSLYPTTMVGHGPQSRSQL